MTTTRRRFIKGVGASLAAASFMLMPRRGDALVALQEVEDVKREYICPFDTYDLAGMREGLSEVVYNLDPRDFRDVFLKPVPAYLTPVWDRPDPQPYRAPWWERLVDPTGRRAKLRRKYGGEG